MRCLAAGIVLAAVLVGTTASAQERSKLKVIKVPAGEAAAKQQSPEIWSYLQELQRQDDPKANVRRAAQFKADQRRLRLESQKWYGYSNLRPVANPIPFTGSYSPMWAGNSWNEYYWYGGGYPHATVYVDNHYLYQR